MKNTSLFLVLLFLVLLFLGLHARGQDSTMHSPTATEHPSGDFITRCFEDLEPIDYFKLNPATRDLEFCSLLTLSYLEVFFEDPEFVEAALVRLRQLAVKFHSEGTPLFISNGMNSVEHCEQLNKEGNDYGITHISMGNSCLSMGAMNEGIAAFNKETIRLVNYTAPSAEPKAKPKK